MPASYKKIIEIDHSQAGKIRLKEFTSANLMYLKFVQGITAPIDDDIRSKIFVKISTYSENHIKNDYECITNLKEDTSRNLKRSVSNTHFVKIDSKQMKERFPER